jgi:hypothetical protein
MNFDNMPELPERPRPRSPARRPLSGRHRGALGHPRGRQGVCFWAGHLHSCGPLLRGPVDRPSYGPRARGARMGRRRSARSGDEFRGSGPSYRA